ncbi:unnamed protein product [Blepharisma stoltei]|uniref:SKP1-like protein n=1 Tax=Blepharisma stoltei TaxID=1481888 RepID=A0AAU9J853_9CILI|nr:unnamed protein product [Blepharisma stoltei]
MFYNFNKIEEVKIRLRSAEGHICEVEESAALMSSFIRSMIEGFNEVTEVSLPNINSVVIEKVIEYMRHYKDKDPPIIKKPIISSKMEENTSAWDAGFIDADWNMVVDLMTAADYLMMIPLRDLCCAKMACKFKGRSIDELRAEYHIENEFPSEMEENLEFQHPWRLE